MAARFSLLTLLAALLVAGCGGPEKIVRPAGNLGDSVNSAGDEFAPTLRPGRPGLWFTSNRRANDDIWRSDVNDPAAGDPLWSLAALDRSDLSRLSQSTTNDGAATFIAPNAGFFASGHAPDTLYARMGPNGYGGIVGGTDLFEFRVDGLRPTVSNLGPAINSQFWESHPSAASRGDTVVMIFASDRPARGPGFSAPYQDAISVESGKAVRGNSDLYAVFRVGGRWDSVVNLAAFSGGTGVNTVNNEYSPYLYCADEGPRLFFSSNRDGDYDIYEAELRIDFTTRRIAVGRVTTLEKGADAINTDDDEFFPHLTPFVEGKGQYLMLSSNREREGRTVGDHTVKSAGGFDLYRFPLKRECRPPQVRLEVTVLDGEDPSRPVQGAFVQLYSVPRGARVTSMPGADPVQKVSGSTAVFTLPVGGEYAVYGGSLYNDPECRGGEQRVTGYYHLRRESRPDFVSPPIIDYEWRDTIERQRRTVVEERTIIDTLTLDELRELSTTPTSVIEAVEREGERVIVTRRERWTVERFEGGVPRRYKARIVRHDTIPQADTLVPVRFTANALAASSRTGRDGNEGMARIPGEGTVRDTILVYPDRYRAPFCDWLFTRDVQSYGRNVPYFQTAFWEVNTVTNLRRHMQMLSGSEMADAGFIELHPRSQYFGVERGDARRARRIAEYRDFAVAVDNNLNRMADSLAGSIIPSFLRFDSANPGSNNKLVVEINSWSDIRPIERGWYTGDVGVRYVSGRLEPVDQTSRAIFVEDVSIAPGTSLVSADNDVLSKLRAWFGYRELLTRLAERPLWSKLVEQGVVVLPDAANDATTYRAQMERAKIIVLMRGRKFDPSVKPEVESYTGQRNDEDYYALDDVRRIDVLVNRMEWVNGRLMVSPCCIPRE